MSADDREVLRIICKGFNKPWLEFTPEEKAKLRAYSESQPAQEAEPKDCGKPRPAVTVEEIHKRMAIAIDHEFDHGDRKCSTIGVCARVAFEMMGGGA